MNKQMKLDKVNESAARLESWTKTLLAHIQKDIPQIRAVLEGTSAVPAGSPKVSWAARLINVERALRDVKTASADLRKALNDD